MIYDRLRRDKYCFS